jgi:uncharacterized DUF497 family protein
VAEIIWIKWHESHITKRHGVSSQDFDDAWHDPERVDLEEEYHEQNGPYTISVGCTRRKGLIMVWRWQGNSDAVWPITAYFPKPKGRRKARKRKR